MAEVAKAAEEPTNVAAGRVQKRKRYDAKPERSTRRDERRELMAKAKSLWEALRPKATEKQKREKLVGELVTILRGRIVEFVFRHDGSRIVQWMLSEGSADQRAPVLRELVDGSDAKALPGEAPFFVRLACDRYGKHLAVKLLRVPDKKHRTAVYERYLVGNVAALMRSAAGADTLDIAFQTVVSPGERARLVLELLFAKEPKLFVAVNAKLAKDGKGKKPPGFAACADMLGDEFKKQILESSAATLGGCIDKESSLRMNIVHCALKEYLDLIMTESPASQTQEIAGVLAPSLVHLTHTKAGAHVAVTCVKVLDAKHRKKAVRSLKGHVRQIAEDEAGHLVLLAFLEWMDDTKIVGSIIYTEIFSKSKVAAELAGEETSEKKNSKKAKEAGVGPVDMEYLTEMCKHKHARRMLLHLLVHRQTRYFNPDLYGHVWSPVDADKFGKMSKKDAHVRRSELLDKALQGLKALIEEQTLPLLQHHFSAPVIVGALQSLVLKEHVALVVSKLLMDDETKQTILGNICARKTLATLFKVGRAEFADRVVETCGADIAVELALDRNCVRSAKNLLMATEKKEAALAVVKAKTQIKKAAKGNEMSEVIAGELLERAKQLTALDSIIGGAIPE